MCAKNYFLWFNLVLQNIQILIINMRSHMADKIFFWSKVQVLDQFLQWPVMKQQYGYGNESPLHHFRTPCINVSMIVFEWFRSEIASIKSFIVLSHIFVILQNFIKKLTDANSTSQICWHLAMVEKSMLLNLSKYCVSKSSDDSQLLTDVGWLLLPE